MYTKKDLVDLFTAKLCTRLSLKNPDDYKIVIFGDAYGDFAPRTVADLRKENIRDVLDWLSMRFLEYFDGETLNKSEFDKWHKDTCEEFIKQFNIKSKTEPIKYGKAQKIVNMTFKYLYCFRDSNDYIDKFEHCHMPIDSIIIDWFVKNVYPCSINISIPKTKLRETAWSKLELGDEKKEGTYLWFQMQIAYYLNSAKNTEYINAGGKPLTPFEAEFAIWDEAISKKIIKRIGILK